MEEYEPFVSLGLALFAGLVIGLEREQSRPDPETGEPFLGGARTYPVFSLLGAAATLLSRELGSWALAVSSAGVFALVAVSFAREVRTSRHNLTSKGAFLLSYLLGALSLTEGVIEPLSQKVFAVAAVAIGASFLLSVKPSLHSFVQRASKEDVLASLKFLLVALVVLPLLPDRTFGPLEVLNPFRVGLFAVFIAGIGFVGYVAMRLWGPRRGLALTGLVGGLVSSTAVTLSFSRKARENPALERSCLLAVVLASSIMFARVLVEVAVVAPALLGRLALPMSAMAVAGVALSGLLYLKPGVRGPAAEVPLANPFDLSSALKFAVLFAVVLLGSKAVAARLGSGGAYLAGLLAGATDVDAVTLSMASLAAAGELPGDTAVAAIYLGAASNTAAKVGMAALAGGLAFGRKVLASLAAVLAVGALGLLALWS